MPIPLSHAQPPSRPASQWENIRPGPWFDLHRNFLFLVIEVVGLDDEPAREIAQLSQQWAEWDLLTSLANYRSVVKSLFGYLTDSPNVRRVLATHGSHQLSLDISSVVWKMNSLLSDSVTYKHFLNSRGSVAQELLDLLQDLLDLSYETSSRPLLSKALLRLSSQSGLHPTCFTLAGVEKVGPQVAGGGFGDIWKGLVDGQTVAVKSMRQFRDDDVKASLKKLGREALIWRQLSHPNLLPFFGLYMLSNRLCLISPWMDDGDLKHFLHDAPLGTDRLSLIADVGMGLEYLHSKHVVHGDLKAANILVTPSGRACITDFGLSTITDELSLQLTFSSQSIRAGTVRYQAPELLLSKSSNHFGSDVYAFACVCYEILTGKVPFFEVSNDATVIFKVIEGTRPSRLDTISPEDLWLLLEACWHQQTDRRPSPTQILQRLTRRPIGAKIKQSAPDWDESYSARFRRSIQEWPLRLSIAEIKQRIPKITVAVAPAGHFTSIARGALDRRSDYVDQSQEVVSGLYQRLPIRDIFRHIRRPPSAVASSALERQERPRGGTLTSTLSAGDRPRIPSEYAPTYWSDISVGTSGLKNLGNTGYMNAPIQCLSATLPFAQFFANGRWKNAVNTLNPLGSRGLLSGSFAKLVHTMWSSDLPYLIPIDFRKAVCHLNSQYSGSNQHDSQEFLSFLLDGIHEDLNRLLVKSTFTRTPEQEAELERLGPQIASEQEWRLWKTRNDSIIVDFFQGQFRNRLECLTCHITSTTYNVFSILQLPIPEGRSSKVPLENCIDAVFNKETLDKDDAWDCPKCKMKRRASKELSLARLPPILVIHLKRFEIHGRFSDKIKTFVDYPLKALDLTNFMPPPLPPGADKNQLNIMSPDDPRSQLPPYRYNLYGVTNHSGNLTSGHYTAYISDRDGWKSCDDSSIQPVDENQVVNQRAYVLFYKRMKNPA